MCTIDLSPRGGEIEKDGGILKGGDKSVAIHVPKPKHKLLMTCQLNYLWLELFHGFSSVQGITKARTYEIPTEIEFSPLASLSILEVQIGTSEFFTVLTGIEMFHLKFLYSKQPLN